MKLITMIKLLGLLFLITLSYSKLAFTAQNLLGEVELIPKDIKTGGIGRYTVGSDGVLHFSFLLCYNRKNCPDVIFNNKYDQHYSDQLLFLYSEENTFEEAFSVLRKREIRCMGFNDCDPELGIHSYALDSDNFKTFLKLRSKSLEVNKDLSECGCSQKNFLSLMYNPSKAKTIFMGKYEYIKGKFYLAVEVGVNVKPSMIEIQPSKQSCNLEGSFFLSKYFIIHTNDVITGDEKSIPPINICNSIYDSDIDSKIKFRRSTDRDQNVNFSHNEVLNFVGDKLGKMNPKFFKIDKKSCEVNTNKLDSLINHPELVKSAFIGHYYLKDDEINFVITRPWVVKGSNYFEIDKKKIVDTPENSTGIPPDRSNRRLVTIFSDFNKPISNVFDRVKSYFSFFDRPTFKVIDLEKKYGVKTRSYLFLSSDDYEGFYKNSRNVYPLNYCTTELISLDSIHDKMGIYNFTGDVNPSWQFCETNDQCAKAENKCGKLKVGINKKYVNDYLKHLKEVKSLIGHYEFINICREDDKETTKEKVIESKCVENFCS